MTVIAGEAATVGVRGAGDLAGLRRRLHDLLDSGITRIDVALTVQPTITCWAMLVDVTRRAREGGGEIRIRLGAAELADDVRRLGLWKVLTVTAP